MWTFEKLDKIFVKANKVKNQSALWKSWLVSPRKFLSVIAFYCWPSEARPTSVLCDKGFLVVEIICPDFCPKV